MESIVPVSPKGPVSINRSAYKPSLVIDLENVQGNYMSNGTSTGKYLPAGRLGRFLGDCGGTTKRVQQTRIFSSQPK